MAGLAAAALAKPVISTVLGATAAKGAHETRKALTQKPPAMKEDTPALLPDEEEQQRAARRRAATRFGQRGSGRASTILSDGQTLGG